MGDRHDHHCTAARARNVAMRLPLPRVSGRAAALELQHAAARARSGTSCHQQILTDTVPSLTSSRARTAAVCATISAIALARSTAIPAWWPPKTQRALKNRRGHYYAATAMAQRSCVRVRRCCCNGHAAMSDKRAVPYINLTTQTGLKAKVSTLGAGSISA
jgi:hypothetical protein